MNEMCGDNRFEIIARAKKHLLDATNIDTSADEMKVLDDFLYRCWQMGWLDRYDTADTPQNEQMKTADYCDICKQDMCKDCIADATNPYCVPSHYEINYEPKDEPKTQMKTQNSNLTFEKRTMLDCYNCKWYKSDDACVECRYEPKTDTPQTDCQTRYCEDCKHYDDVNGHCFFIGRCTYEPKGAQTDCGWSKPDED